jgi:asparagine synthase (glutamine-hydrolysing)
MCGITGFLDRTTSTDGQELGALVARMADTLHHRGPDDTGIWTDVANGLAFGHKRLSIIDLSPNGRQPMHSACGRFCIVYNGEIYNHAELRRELAALGHCFRGHSDTEVLLEAVAAWGLKQALSRFVGMFAFALWDRTERRLTLVRDRLGIKPLYYAWMGNVFLFGSELKAVRAHPAFRGEIDRNVLALYLQYNYIPAPYSIYRRVCKLPAGSLLSISPGDEDSSPETYWDMKEVAEAGAREPFQGSPDEAADELDERLRTSVGLRMEADVPLGAFLSGGVDSSTVVALMQTQSSRPVKTFSIGFEERDYNEAGFAKAVASHLGTEHTECYLTPQQARDVIPRLPSLYDEPFSDSSQIPTFLVSEIARRHVTVSLSGDGGDELFGGYDRYAYMQKMWRKIGNLPKPLRRVAARIIRAGVPRNRFGTLGRKARTLAGFLDIPDARSMYAWLNTHWKHPTAVVIDGFPPATIFSQHQQWADRGNLLEEMMYVDSVAYLPDDILVKVDRASMGVSLEARVPLLDHRVVEFAWQIGPDLKVRNGQSKWLLRQVLDRYVPRNLIERPKVGFGVPIDSWLRGPLREWAEELLDERRLKNDGFFQPQPIRNKWAEHLSGQSNWHYDLWDVLMFQAWLASS